MGADPRYRVKKRQNTRTSLEFVKSSRVKQKSTSDFPVIQTNIFVL